MNFKKTIAALAAATLTAVSASAMASAELIVIDPPLDANGDKLICSDSGSFLGIGYYDGSREKLDKGKAVVDYGIDWSQAKSVEVVFHITADTQADFDESENAIGGAIIVSSNSETDTTHNWPAKEFYGVNDDALGFTAESAKELTAEKVSDYTYKIVAPIDDTNCVVDNPTIVQICFADWSGVVWWQAAVETLSVKDGSGNTLISWKGADPLSSGGAVNPAVNAPTAAAAAPAVTDTAPATTGDVQAATDSSKGSPDTGIADVAAIAGLAVVAGGALVVAKKRK